MQALTVAAAWTPAGDLALAYALEGSLPELRIPAPHPPGFADGLWQHTCFEAFLAVAANPACREFNFSPSGQWAAYAFSGYRQRDESFRPDPAPAMTLRLFADRLELDAVIPRRLLPALPGGSALRFGLSAVVEAAAGGKSYWALAHPGEAPDFHRRDAFILTLPAFDAGD